jgi:hypothetical protein
MDSTVALVSVRDRMRASVSGWLVVERKQTKKSTAVLMVGKAQAWHLRIAGTSSKSTRPVAGAKLAIVVVKTQVDFDAVDTNATQNNSFKGMNDAQHLHASNLSMPRNGNGTTCCTPVLVQYCGCAEFRRESPRLYSSV